MLPRKVVKRKLLILDGDTPHGRQVDTVFEYIDEDQKFHKVMSKRKQHNFSSWNKMKERIEFCRYRGAEWCNVFITGGAHDIRFALGLQKLKALKHELTLMIRAITEAKKCRDERESNPDKNDRFYDPKTFSKQRKKA